jgi:hypothetical protein
VKGTERVQHGPDSGCPWTWEGDDKQRPALRAKNDAPTMPTAWDLSNRRASRSGSRQPAELKTRTQRRARTMLSGQKRCRSGLL